MKRRTSVQAKEQHDVFSYVPADLYPLLVPGYSQQVDAFRQLLAIRCVSHTMCLTVEYVLAQIKTLGSCVTNILRQDGQMTLLRGLTTLNLRWNRHITCGALTHLACLTELRMANGGAYDLGGLVELPSLTVLSLKNTRNWSLHDLCRLTGLTKLNIRRCSLLMDHELKRLQVLTRLEELKVGPPQEGKHLSMLTTLRKLDYRSLDLSDEPRLSVFFTHLTSLKLHGLTFLAATETAWFSQFSVLTHLYLDFCDIDATAVRDTHLILPATLVCLSLVAWQSVNKTCSANMLVGLTNLRRLDLRQNSSLGEETLSHLSALERLSVIHNSRISGKGLLSLASSLKRLNMIAAHAIMDAELAQMTTLTHLNIASTNHVSGDAIRQLTNLRTLVCNSQVTDACLVLLTSLTSLSVHPRDATITSRSISRLTNLENLTALGTLGYGRQFIPALASLPRLKRLVSPGVVLVKADLLYNQALTHLACMGGTHIDPAYFDHLPYLQSLCITVQHNEEDQRAYESLATLRHRGIVVSSCI